MRINRFIFAIIPLCITISLNASQLRLAILRQATRLLQATHLNCHTSNAPQIILQSQSVIPQLKHPLQEKQSSSMSSLRHMSSSARFSEYDYAAKKKLPAAIVKDDIEGVKKLLHSTNKRIINAKVNNEETVLLFAINHEHHHIASYLIEQGANPNLYDAYGETALVKALKKSWFGGVRMLLNAGTNLNIKTAFHASMPLVQAAEMQNEELVKEFFKHGADPKLVYDYIKHIHQENKISSSMLTLFEKHIQDLNTKIARKSEQTFADIAGDIPDEVNRLVSYLKDSKIRERYTRFNVQPPKGIIFYGPPGTGKTMLARAMAGQAKVPFKYVKISDVLSKWVGESESKIRALFQEAQKEAQNNPQKTSILFFDELDAIGSSRNADSKSWEISKLNALLAEIDGFEPSTGVLVIGATNRLEFLDPALTREGRFDTKINIDLPGPEKQKAILKLYLSKLPYENAQCQEHTEKLINTVLTRFKQSTHTISPALLKNIIDEAARRTVETASDVLLDSTILQVVDEHIKKNPIKGWHIL